MKNTTVICAAIGLVVGFTISRFAVRAAMGDPAPTAAQMQARGECDDQVREALAGTAPRQAAVPTGPEPSTASDAGKRGIDRVAELARQKAIPLDPSARPPTPRSAPQGALLASILAGNAAAVEAALESDPASLERADDKGQTPLHLATVAGQVDVVRALLSRGAAVEAKDANQRTPLHRAAELSRLDVIDLLLERGANINATSRSGRTPLQVAVAGQKTEVIQVLLEKRADTSNIDVYGMTALAQAKKFDMTTVIALLQRYGVDD